MSNPRVIKNNDGVAVVEGTPASSLVKDVDKFFATKPPERMAGESISQPKKIDPKAIDTKSTGQEKKENFLDFYKKQSSPIFDGKGNVIGFKDGSKGTTEMFDKPVPKEEYEPPTGSTPQPFPNMDERVVSRRPEEFNKRFDPRAVNTKSPIPKKPQSERRDKETLKEYAARMGRPGPKKNESEDQPRIPRDSKPRRNEAKDRATTRRERFFERRRSRKEAERSQTEQEATQGKFITTLRR